MRSSFLVCFNFAPKFIALNSQVTNKRRQFSTKLKVSSQMSILGFYGINGVEKTDIGARCIHSHLIHNDHTVNNMCIFLFNEALRTSFHSRLE